jgi:hypothetical protein
VGTRHQTCARALVQLVHMSANENVRTSSPCTRATSCLSSQLGPNAETIVHRGVARKLVHERTMADEQHAQMCSPPGRGERKRRAWRDCGVHPSVHLIPCGQGPPSEHPRSSNDHSNSRQSIPLTKPWLRTESQKSSGRVRRIEYQAPHEGGATEAGE